MSVPKGEKKWFIEINICSYCLGSGKLKAMQSSAVIGGGSIRGVDTKVKCEYCGGGGLAK